MGADVASEKGRALTEHRSPQDARCIKHLQPPVQVGRVFVGGEFLCCVKDASF
jgi:hypothetical protein